MARRNPNGALKGFQKNMKEILSMETLTDSAIIATGSVLTPITSGVITGMLNKIKVGMVPSTGFVAKFVDLLGAAVVATGASFVAKKAATARLMMLGGMAGVITDATTEYVLPALGLSDYLTAADLGISGIRDYLTADQLGLKDYATVTQVAQAGESYTQGEEF